MPRGLTIVLGALVAACCGLALLHACAPGYLTQRGFPLDDAWIHMVYGRSLARSASLSYNPGIAATGETAPLWAWIVAVPHLLASEPRTLAIAVKLLGFALHAATVVAAAFALPREIPALARAAGAGLVAVHPDLVAASVAGMEVPLATLLAVLILATARRSPAWTVAAVAMLAPIARPELCVLTVVVHAGHVACDRRQLRRATIAALATMASFGWMALRNWSVSGRPLPATFYAKFGRGGGSTLERLVNGFGSQMNELAGFGPWVPLACIAAGWLLWTRRRHSDIALAIVASTCFLAASFVATPSVDPRAFYHQRYVLPAVPLLLLAVPAALSLFSSPRIRTAAVALAVLWLAGASLVRSPARYRHLENDAHNVDDVQVTVGRALAGAPSTVTVWAVDAGAIRYFGDAFVVDMIGLNSPELLTTRAATYLDAHRPNILELVPRWSFVDPRSALLMRGGSLVARPSTPYTVTSYPAMADHALALCPPSERGIYSVRGASYPFTCAQ